MNLKCYSHETLRKYRFGEDRLHAFYIDMALLRVVVMKYLIYK